MKTLESQKELPHLGKLVEQRLDSIGMTKAAPIAFGVGRRINTSRQNVNSLLNKASMDVGMLWRISHALEHDFFHSIILAMGLVNGIVPDKSMEALRLTSQMQETIARLNMVLVGGS